MPLGRGAELCTEILNFHLRLPTYVKQSEKMYPQSVCCSPLGHKPTHWQKYATADSTS